MLSETPLWSRSQTSTGAIVPISATARSRNTPLASFCACSPSWLASSSRIASALPVAKALKVWLSLRPLATMKFSTRTSSSRPNRRASASTLPNRSRSALPSTSTKPEPWASALASRLRMAVVLPAPVVPGMVMCWRASSAVTQSSWPLMLQPMNRLPAAGFGLRLPGVGIAVVGQAGAARQAHRQLRPAGSAPRARRASGRRDGEIDDGRLEERAGRRASRAPGRRRSCAAPPTAAP